MKKVKTHTQLPSEESEGLKQAPPSKRHLAIMGSSEGDQKRFWEKVEIKSQDDCWEWKASLNWRGYGEFSINDINIGAHRFSFFIKNGFINPDLLICHQCDNTSCVNPAHLFQGSNLDNKADCVAKKRHAYGERCGATKLTEDLVLMIRDIYFRGKHTKSEMGRMFGINRNTIHKIMNKSTWKHI